MKTPRYAFLAAVLIAWVGVSTANSQAVEWARQLGTESFDLGSDVSVDGIGNVFISGFSSLGLDDTNPDARGAFVSKFDTEGNLDWTRHLGVSLELVNFYGVSADGKGNVYVSGVTHRGRRTYSFLSMFNIDGDLNWNREIEGSVGSNGDSGFFSGGRVNVFADGRGSIYTSGSTFGAFDGENAGGADVFLRKYDEEGNLDWTRQLGTSATDKSYGVTADGSGSVFISGWTGGDLSGDNAGGADAFVSKYDEEGNLDWTRLLGTVRSDASYGATSDGKGNVFISGFTQGNLNPSNVNCRSCETGSYYDAFVSKFDGEGNLDWTSQLDFSGNDESRGVSVDGLGNVYISGFTNGSVDGPNAGREDAFLVKLNDETFVPEPSSLLLVLSAMVALMGRRRVG